MALDRIDKEFRHEGVSYLDYKQVEMDRVLTAFLARLWWSGQSSVISRTRAPDRRGLRRDDRRSTRRRSQDFDPAVTRRWVETHLLDMVSRGKSQPGGGRPAAAARVHLPVPQRPPVPVLRRRRAAVRDAQPRVEQRGQVALAQLKDFFFAGVDARTEAPRLGDDIDVETQALISLSEAVKGEITDRASGDRDRRSYPPLYQEASDLLADDVLRLLYHRHLIPRTVLVDYLKILFAFHLALYHLKIMKLLPAMVRGDRASTAGRRVLPRRHRTAGQRARPGSPSGAPPTWYRPDTRVRAGHLHGEEARRPRASTSPSGNPRLPPGGWLPGERSAARCSGPGTGRSARRTRPAG